MLATVGDGWPLVDEYVAVEPKESVLRRSRAILFDLRSRVLESSRLPALWLLGVLSSFSSLGLLSPGQIQQYRQPERISSSSDC